MSYAARLVSLEFRCYEDRTRARFGRELVVALRPRISAKLDALLGSAK